MTNTEKQMPETTPRCRACGRREGFNGHAYGPCTERHAVLYTDSHGTLTQDTFATLAEAAEREAYLHARGRSACVVSAR